MESRAHASSERYVSCPLCPWRCLHHGKRADGLPVSWRLPADQAVSSGGTRGRSLVNQFAKMRAHVRGHELNSRGDAAEVARAKVAMAFIPCRHKKVEGETKEERDAGSKRRYREQRAEDSRKRRKLKREERDAAKILKVCGSGVCASIVGSDVRSGGTRRTKRRLIEGAWELG